MLHFDDGSGGRDDDDDIMYSGSFQNSKRQKKTKMKAK